MVGKLILEDGSVFEGQSFGAEVSRAGEVVFATGMMGYPESLTDPSYQGQILILTYPLVGNYGVPNKSFWESDNIKVSGLIVSDYIDSPSHYQSKKTLARWFKEEKIPLLEIKDTRLLTQKIRAKGALLGKIVFDKDVEFYDPNTESLVAQVSIKKPVLLKSSVSNKNKKVVVLIDCGAKKNIQNCLLQRGVDVITVPWDFNPFSTEGKQELQKLISPSLPSPNRRGMSREAGQGEVGNRQNKPLFDALVVSNGPGDPKLVDVTIQTIKQSLDRKMPTLGVCLGHQLLALAAGGDTSKLKYGHRSQNQPCIMADSERPALTRRGRPALTRPALLRGERGRCFITTQNHGFHVNKIPTGFKAWFTNANDGSNEGIIHKSLPIMSVQFHPEATPGPMDAEWIFDFFLEKI